MLRGRKTKGGGDVTQGKLVSSLLENGDSPVKSGSTDASTSAPQPLVVHEKSQEEGQDQVLKDVKEEQETTSPTKEQLACDDSEPAIDDGAPADLASNKSSTATGDTRTSASSIHQTHTTDPVDRTSTHPDRQEQQPVIRNVDSRPPGSEELGIQKDKSGRAVSALLEKHDITKFGKLMSVVVLKTWPTNSNGVCIEGDDLLLEYLLNWPMAKSVFQMTDGHCDDGRCKDDRNIKDY
ncbi:hypothetical protein INR49_025353 [Caranx melampygus]|nr:hypothetical protein INR49_025353 [Caranx melampygus]